MNQINENDIPEKVFEESAVFCQKVILPYHKKNLPPCFVELLLLDDRAIAILSEMKSNKKTSLTKNFEYMATEIYLHHLVIGHFPNEVIWVEYYPASAYGNKNHGPTYSQVTLEFINADEGDHLINPKWKHLKSVEEVKALRDITLEHY